MQHLIEKKQLQAVLRLRQVGKNKFPPWTQGGGPEVITLDNQVHITRWVLDRTRRFMQYLSGERQASIVGPPQPDPNLDIITFVGHLPRGHLAAANSYWSKTVEAVECQESHYSIAQLFQSRRIASQAQNRVHHRLRGLIR
jgi:hypothetical protein